MTDIELVSAIAFGLSYFYKKFKLNKITTENIEHTAQTNQQIEETQTTNEQKPNIRTHPNKQNSNKKIQHTEETQTTNVQKANKRTHPIEETSDNQRKRRRRSTWMINTHRSRTREFTNEKFMELLQEPSGEFDNFCHMTYIDFELLLNQIMPLISKQDTYFREAIPAKYRLAITLRYLASGESYKSLHNLFKVSSQAICKIVQDVSKAINKVLKDEIKMPSTAKDWIEIERGYSREFPHCVGSLDGKYTITQWSIERSKIVTITLVDNSYKFTFVDIGCQKSICDNSVFNDSLLWQRICTNEINFPPPSPLPGSNTKVPYIILSDGAFPMSTHIMTPYSGDHHIGSRETKLNERLSRSRVVVENTFGKLNSVFRIFRTRIHLKPDHWMDIMMTCLLLHNFLMKSNNSSERYNPPGTFDAYDVDGTLITPGAWRYDVADYNTLKNLPQLPQGSSLNAIKVREEFTKYFWNE